jgi:Na+/melibiose symporter-like transporter
MRCIIWGRLWIAFITPCLLKVQIMSHKQQTTIFGIVFWTLLLASVGLVDRYQWLQAAWVFVCIGFLVVGAVSSTVEMYRTVVIRNRNVDCLPRWMMWVVLDDEQYDKYLHRRRLTAPDKKAY